MTLTLFSQKNTNNSITDSLVCLPKNVAREVVKDLIRKDSLQAELNTCHKNYDILNKNISYKDSIINSKSNQLMFFEEKEKNYKVNLAFKDEKIENLNTLVKDMNKDIKKMKFKLVLKKIETYGLFGGILLLGYILIK